MGKQLWVAENEFVKWVKFGGKYVGVKPDIYFGYRSKHNTTDQNRVYRYP